MKNNDWKERLNIVYSTNPNYNYEMNDDEEQATLAPAQQRLRVQLDRKNRGGKSSLLSPVSWAPTMTERTGQIAEK